MHDIFISYRRIDTEASGGHLFADLCRSFGANSVFMDTRRGGIPWGADWEQTLNAALQGCKALIVLIGPQWATCERSPGCRRLDAPDDWVRGEIATALRRGILVLPVLFQGAKPVQEDSMPQELRELGFHKRQACAIAESNWDIDVARLIEALIELPPLKQSHDLATGETGIRLLEQLIRDNPEVAETVVRSQDVIASMDRELDDLKLLKDIHDALHDIEAACLIPMCQEFSPARLRAARRTFSRQHGAIRPLLDKAAALQESPALLTVDLPSQLTAASEALEEAAAKGGVDDYHKAIAELEGLISYVPVRLDLLIDNAATRLQLERLLELMTAIHDLLPPATATRHGELKPLLDGIDALGGLRDELVRRVREHGLLQSLDNHLHEVVGGQRRRGTSARIEPAALVADWNQIRRLRARFMPPFSPELEDGIRNFEELEPDIETAVGRGDEPEVADRLAEYFNEVGEVFRVANGKLKEFCSRLREVTRPLRTILDMCRVEARHA